MTLSRLLIFLLICLSTLIGCSNANLKKPSPTPPFKIGLCIVATGRYGEFAQELIYSARNYFCKQHKVTYFVFTDFPIAPAPDVVIIHQNKMGWPYDALKRCYIYCQNEHLFKDYDYLFAIDADMRFFSEVGTEILGKSVGVARSVGKHMAYENNKKSKAYLSKIEAKNYFAGAFYGGERESFLKMIKRIKHNIEADLKKDFIAKFHDESHLNRYFYDYPPEVVLDTSYCYPEGLDIPYTPKIVALLKNYKECPATLNTTSQINNQ